MRKNHYNLCLTNSQKKQKLKIKTKISLKTTESEGHLSPYHFLYFLFLSQNFLSNQNTGFTKQKGKSTDKHFTEMIN